MFSLRKGPIRRPTRQSLRPSHSEAFRHRLQIDGLNTYKKFYQDQYNYNYNMEVIERIVNNLDKQTEEKSLTELKNRGKRLLSERKVLPNLLNGFVIDYVESMFELMKKYDDELVADGSYHTDFTKGTFDELLAYGDNTGIFFSFEDADDEFLLHIRPTCMYFAQLLDLPQITSSPNSALKSPRKRVEGNSLNFREFTFHDLGHAYIMKRHDIWLFKESKLHPTELVKKWIYNKDSYFNAINELKDTDFPLYKAVMLWMFDVFHDRGYQFDLAIARQQFMAEKNLQNLRTKVSNNMFEGIYDPISFDRISDAQQWLIKTTEYLLLQDNQWMLALHDDLCLGMSQNPGTFEIKRYPNILSVKGIPQKIILCKGREIKVVFSCGYYTETTSIYEIELLKLAPRIIDDAQRKAIMKYFYLINKGIADSIVLDVFLEPNIEDIPNIDVPDIYIRPIVWFKLERIWAMMWSQSECNFCLTKNYDRFESSKIVSNISNDSICIDTGIALSLKEITIEDKKPRDIKTINTDPHYRYIATNILDKAYLKQEIYSPFKPYVELDNGMRLGMVNTIDFPAVGNAVSSLLSRSIDWARESRGGYLPDWIVSRAQREYVSPYALSHLWGSRGRRFVLTMPIDSRTSELIGTVLVSSGKNNLFFYTNKYNNIYWPDCHKLIDTELVVNGEKWFDRFDMPEMSEYKITDYNQIANFSIDENHRGHSLGKLLIDSVIKYYAINSPDFCRNHSQYLICGSGLFQIADPSWLPFMLNCGFKHRAGAETFYVETVMSSLINMPKYSSHVEYNRIHRLFDLYAGETNKEFALNHRIPHVLKLANSNKAKLQYYQLIRKIDE